MTWQIEGRVNNDRHVVGFSLSKKKRVMWQAMIGPKAVLLEGFDVVAVHVRVAAHVDEVPRHQPAHLQCRATNRHTSPSSHQLD